MTVTSPKVAASPTPSTDLLGLGSTITTQNSAPRASKGASLLVDVFSGNIAAFPVETPVSVGPVADENFSR